MALAATLLAPAYASAAPGDPTCAADKTLTVTFTTRDGEDRVPLVATNEVTVVARWSGDARGQALSVPEGVRVLGTLPTRMRLVAPVSASLAVTASWEQATDPSDIDSDPSNPATRCVATQTTALPVTATRPPRAFYKVGPQFSDGYLVFAVVPDQQAGDLSPMEVSVRSAVAARFPSPSSRAWKLPVAMRLSERVRYARRIPNSGLLSTPDRCRYYSLTCGRRSRVNTEVNVLGERPLSRVRERNFLLGPPLSRVQPYRQVAPHGISVRALIFSQPGHEPPAVSYDIQVRQSGRLVARVRRAARCGQVSNGFGETFYRCRVVLSKNG